ncbi:hypothetical protein KAJ83_15755 [Marivibrio halodurans]|uniref:Uncharacterized protein n=1 Tax=Marivibrio halodurans TaxID=2039722 RepID=A0A8J7V3P2_9PROT|nr:hypothetical protein [Marivibrio halodurans]MBP5858476.1 hypothetical protein [Marivibrio halodurans]
MVSPYLEKPRRRLDEALRDRGLSGSDIGFDPTDSTDAHTPVPEMAEATRDARQARVHATTARLSIAIGSVATCLLIILVVAALWTPLARGIAPVADRDADLLSDIAPAAGPDPTTRPSRNIAPTGVDSEMDTPNRIWNPAPSLAPIDPS